MRRSWVRALFSLSTSARKAADDTGEKTAGRTDVGGIASPNHDHGYVYITLPDGTVYGVTDEVAGHFHIIRNPDTVEEADVDNHNHKILAGEPTDGEPTDDEPEDDESEGSPGSPGSPGGAETEPIGSPGA